MKEYIDKLKEIETLVELSIGTTMTEEKATDIYAVTNDLICKIKKLNIPTVTQRREQLIAFANYCERNWNCTEIPTDVIDEYLESN